MEEVSGINDPHSAEVHGLCGENLIQRREKMALYKNFADSGYS
jgi:hypothetical protein